MTIGVTPTAQEIVFVETRIKTAIKSKSDLYPNEVVIVDYTHTFIRSNLFLRVLMV